MKSKQRRFTVRSRLESIPHAIRGLADMLRTEHNAWVHAVATVLVLILCSWLKISRNDFALVIVAIVMVWAAEAFNTVLEIMADLVITGEQPSQAIKRAKDIAAGAVLAACLGAAAIGIIVLGPYLSQRLSQS